MITASQPQVTSLPLQVRCSSQPTGLCSNFHRIQRRKIERHRMGVQNVACHQSCRCEGGSSCQTRRVFAPVKKIAATKTSTEMTVTCAIAQTNWLVEAKRRYIGQRPIALVRNPKPARNAKSEFNRHAPDGLGLKTDDNRISPTPIPNVSRRTIAKIAARSRDRSQALPQAEASKPAANAQQIELKFMSTDSASSLRLTPPRRNGTVNTGATASHRVRARNPWANPLANTMSVAASRVRKSNPKVPSRRSRLMQSAVNKGTRIQIAQNSVKWRLPNNLPPRTGLKPFSKPNSTLASNRAATPSDRRW